MGNDECNNSICCSGINDNTNIVYNKFYINKLMKSYENFKKIAIYFKNNNEFKSDVFLIDVNSIKEFMENIKNSNVLDELKDNNIEKKESYNKLKKNFCNYRLERNIKIFSDYEECLKIAENKEENKNNQFIIVEEEFLKNMNVNYNESLKVNIDLSKREDKIMKIIFNGDNHPSICFKEISFGIFSFIINEDYNNKNILIYDKNDKKKNTEVQNNINNREENMQWLN